MRNIRLMAVAGALGLGVCGLAVAHGVVRHHLGQHGKMNPDSATQHFAQYYPKFAAFDAHHNGILDARELKELGAAVRDGALELPFKADAGDEGMLNHFAEVYAKVAVFDANHDGSLDSTEQSAIKSALESGAFVFPAPH